MKLFLHARAREHTRKLLFYTKLRDNEVKITDIEIYIYIYISPFNKIPIYYYYLNRNYPRIQLIIQFYPRER